MVLDYTTYRLDCKRPFTISRSSNSHYDRVFIYLEQDCIVGRGEAAPSERYNESTVQISDILKEGIRLPKNISDIEEVIDLFDDYTRGIKAFRSACVNALLDWWTLKNQQSITDYFNIDNKNNTPTSYTIAISNLSDLKEKIEETKEYKIIKIKLGTDKDKEIIREIRKHTNKKIRVDANEAWNLDTAVEICNWLAEKNVELVEQPLPERELDKMSELKAHSPLPLIADENCHNSKDIEKLVDGFNGINIKLAKCGGLDEAMRMINLAKKYKLKIMLGCMIESSLGITAIGQLASEADYLDIDGNLLIKNDPYCGIKINCGIPKIPNAYGMGIELNDKFAQQNSQLK